MADLNASRKSKTRPYRRRWNEETMPYYPMSCHGVTFPGRYVGPNGTFWLHKDGGLVQSYKQQKQAKTYTIVLQGRKFLKAAVVWESCRGVIVDEDMLFGYYDLNKSNLALDNLHPFTSIDSVRLFHQQRANVIYPKSMFRPWTSISNYDISSRTISTKQYDLIGVNGEVFVMDYLMEAMSTGETFIMPSVSTAVEEFHLEGLHSVKYNKGPCYVNGLYNGSTETFLVLLGGGNFDTMIEEILAMD